MKKIFIQRIFNGLVIAIKGMVSYGSVLLSGMVVSEGIKVFISDLLDLLAF